MLTSFMDCLLSALCRYRTTKFYNALSRRYSRFALANRADRRKVAGLEPRESFSSSESAEPNVENDISTRISGDACFERNLESETRSRPAFS